MALVPAKCPQCGGNIEVDDTHEAGICKFCGTPFVTEKAINNYNTYITNNNNFTGATINIAGADPANLITLAESKFEESSFAKALEYCDKALEINVEMPEIWEIKAKANLGLMIANFEKIKVCQNDSSFNSSQYIENAKILPIIKSNIENFNKYKGNNFSDEKCSSFYEFVISKMSEIISYANEMALTASWKTMIGNVAETPEKKYAFHNQCDNIYKAILVLDPIIDMIFNSVVADLGCVKSSSLLDCIKSYFKYKSTCQTNLSKEYSTANLSFDESIYSSMVNCLPDESKSKVPQWSEIYNEPIKNKATSPKSGGCYIATCIYGSYDCPQVWTLRRYRDYTLDLTWYGRLFIKCYYAVSPKLVKWFGKYEWFRKPWKKFLDDIVERLNSDGVEDTKYFDKY